MSTNDIPVGFVAKQSQTTTPVNSDATLVDDPVALVDSSTALVGGPVTIVESIQAKAVPLVPRPRVKINR